MDLCRAEMLAGDLISYHLPNRRYHPDWAWKLKFDKAKTRLGCCDYDTHTISLGQHATLVNTEEQVLNTILHEIAHALCTPREGHGPAWRANFLELGGDGKRCGNIRTEFTPKWVLKCSSCKNFVGYYRKPKWSRRCRYCFTKLVLLSPTHEALTRMEIPA